MAVSPGKRRQILTAIAAIGFAGWSGIACGLGGPPIVFPPAPAQCVWEGVERVVAVGDVHGDYQAFVKILRDRGLIGEGADPPWTGGTAHLIQIGDVIDRMPNPTRPNEPVKGPRDIYMLISRLEREAAAAGGMVHFLPGNHEEMTLARVSMQYAGYVTLDQFQSFVHGAYRSMHERAAARMNAEDANRYWQTLMNTAGAQTEYYDGYRDAVGAWIVGHNVIIKINGVVFVHGGISLEDSRRSLESINARYRRAFIQLIRDEYVDRTIIFNEFGPLWARNLDSGNSNAVSESDVKQILSNLKAKSIVIGHSPTTVDTAKRFRGLVWIIDSFISEKYEEIVGFSQLSAIEVDRDGEIQHVKGDIRYGPKKKPDGDVPRPGNLVGLFLRLCSLGAAGDA